MSRLPMRSVVALISIAMLWSASGCATADRSKPAAKTAATPAPEGAKDEAPRFDELLGLDGHKTSLAAHRKKVTVLSMWSTYCEPCIAEMPFVEALYQKYKDDPEVAVLSVAVDPVKKPEDLAPLKKIVQARGLTAPVLVDQDHALVLYLSAQIPQPAGAAPAKAEKKEVSFALPLNAIVDGAFKAHVFTGLEEGLTKEAYLDKLSSLIDLGRAGRLPDSPPLELGPPPGASGEPERLAMKIPGNLSVEQRLEHAAGIRSILAKTFPYLTPEQLGGLMKQVEDQLRVGNVVSLEIPPAPAQK